MKIISVHGLCLVFGISSCKTGTQTRSLLCVPDNVHVITAVLLHSLKVTLKGGQICWHASMKIEETTINL